MMEEWNDFEYLSAAILPSISESLIESAQQSRAAEEAYEHDKLKKRAAAAGFDNVAKYEMHCLMKDPKFPARRYLECVNEYGAGSTRCEGDKELWLERKTAQNGNKVAWNEEDVFKMLKEDAIKAGYTEGYFRKNDPEILEYAAREYKKCIAKHGAENTLCKFHKNVWMICKKVQKRN